MCGCALISCYYLIFAQRIVLDLDAILGDYINRDRVAAVDISLRGRDERIADNSHGSVACLVAHQVLVELERAVEVLETKLGVENGLDESGRRAGRTVHLALETTHRIVAKHGALTVRVETSDDCVDIIGKESLVVEHGRGELCDRWRGHRFQAVLVLVHSQAHFESLHERETIAVKADTADHAVRLERERVWFLARQN